MNLPVTEKQKMRSELSIKRSEISSEFGREYSEKICINLEKLATYRYAESYLLYYPLRNEVDITPVINKLLSKKGAKVYLPRCIKGEEGRMVFCEVNSSEDLEKGSFGVMEPREKCKIQSEFSQNTVCIVPAIAYDKQGYRIGYGKGYYDRFLRHFKGTKIGVAFSQLVLDFVPRGKYDNCVDIVITERGVTLANS